VCVWISRHEMCAMRCVVYLHPVAQRHCYSLRATEILMSPNSLDMSGDRRHCNSC